MEWKNIMAGLATLSYYCVSLANTHTHIYNISEHHDQPITIARNSMLTRLGVPSGTEESMNAEWGQP
jgi:hypothetical protein